MIRAEELITEEIAGMNYVRNDCEKIERTVRKSVRRRAATTTTDGEDR